MSSCISCKKQFSCSCQLINGLCVSCNMLLQQGKIDNLGNRILTKEEKIDKLNNIINEYIIK